MAVLITARVTDTLLYIAVFRAMNILSTFIFSLGLNISTSKSPLALSRIKDKDCRCRRHMHVTAVAAPAVCGSAEVHMSVGVTASAPVSARVAAPCCRHNHNPTDVGVLCVVCGWRADRRLKEAYRCMQALCAGDKDKGFAATIPMPIQLR
jgi:hypothetical protein